jgi:addiction module RelE/StbE family toxin
MVHRVVLSKRAQKDLNNIDWRYRSRILTALFVLSLNPYSGKFLQGQYQGQRSYAVWPYRIIYELISNKLIVSVIRIGHRQGVYK